MPINDAQPPLSVRVRSAAILLACVDLAVMALFPVAAYVCRSTKPNVYQPAKCLIYDHFGSATRYGLLIVLVVAVIAVIASEVWRRFGEMRGKSWK